MVNRSVSVRKKKGAFKRLRSNWELLLLCVPALVCYILYSYIPMIGLVLPFKNYKFNLGLFGSKWIGLKNFNFLFKSTDLWRITRNTVLYAIVFLIVGSIVNIGVSLLLFEIKERRGSLKTYQTIMTFPNFMSWVIVGFITYAVFNPVLGVMNQLIRALGGAGVDVYSSPKYWPFIIVFVNTWKGVGMGSMMYLANLLGIDASLYEAATIDGANRLQQTRYISLPSIIPLWTIMTILAVGGLFRGDFGLFYQIPRNVGILYETTDIIDTFVFRGLQNNNYGQSSAVGFVQSVLGLICVGGTNWIVSKISPDNAMF